MTELTTAKITKSSEPAGLIKQSGTAVEKVGGAGHCTLAAPQCRTIHTLHGAATSPLLVQQHPK